MDLVTPRCTDQSGSPLVHMWSTVGYVYRPPDLRFRRSGVTYLGGRYWDRPVTYGAHYGVDTATVSGDQDQPPGGTQDG